MQEISQVFSVFSRKQQMYFGIGEKCAVKSRGQRRVSGMPAELRCRTQVLPARKEMCAGRHGLHFTAKCDIIEQNMYLSGRIP